MKHARIVLFALAAVLVATSIPAAAAVKGSADVVAVSPAAKTVTASPGERVSLGIDLDIAKTWHLYAHGDTNYIGVDLVPEEGFPLEDLQVEYPAGHPKEFFGEMVAMIEGKARITATALVPEGLAQGGHLLSLKVTAQACDDKTCLAPARIPVTISLMVP